jgi:ribosome-binding factor A
MRMKVLPDLEFVEDATAREADRIAELLRDLHEGGR